jgi:hypothetical protein
MKAGASNVTVTVVKVTVLGLVNVDAALCWKLITLFPG